MSTSEDTQRPPDEIPCRGSRPRRTPEEDAEWEAEKRLEHDADRCCGHDWSNT
jgi:hypothetical protein